MTVLRRALAVDDHPVNRLLAARQLETLGFDVDTAADGAAALDRFAAGCYDLVVLDCAMPGMDGFEVARRMRAIEARACRLRSLIIACTAGAANDLEGDCRAAGMDGCIAKPSSVQTLARCLGHAEAGRAAEPPDHGAEAVDADPVDMQFVAANFGADDCVARRLLRDFVEINGDDLRALREAIGRHDAAAVARCAHRVLGAARMIGAAPLARVASRLEALAPARDWTRVSGLVSVFEHECRRIERFVARTSKA